MKTNTYNYVFGPIISRRLGRSLGIDVVPFKTCTYDCIYCQLGATPQCTLERSEYVPLHDILDELDRKLASQPNADYVSIAGSGEPTLYSRLGELIAAIKARTQTPVAVITNGSLLWDRNVQEDLLQADLVIPNLDAATPEAFIEINRQHADLTFEKMLQGLIDFRNRFRGQIWLEVFVLANITDSDAHTQHLAKIVSQIHPDKVQLNTMARPAPGTNAQPVTRERLAEIAAVLGPIAEIIAQDTQPTKSPHTHATPEDVLDILKRHPCTAKDIAAGLRISVQEAEAHLETLQARDAIVPHAGDNATFYLVK